MPHEESQITTDLDILAHLGDEYESYQGAVIPPIFMNSLHVTPKRDIDCETPRKYSYGRDSNPTTSVFERKLAALERAERALAFASGMAAISAALLANIKAGDHIVCVDTAYVPTRMFIQDELCAKFGLEATFIAGDNIKEWEDATRANTTVYYLESPSSSVFSLQDLRAVSQLAKSRGIITIIDNSWATPLYQKPITLGIDLSVHTVSKYIGGHSDIIAGVVAGNEPLMSKVHQIRAIYGGILQPMEAWLATRGLRSLAVRIQAHEKSAGIVARRLEAHRRVLKVNYPGLDSHPQRELALRQMKGATSPLSFELDCDNTSARGFVKRLEWFNVGPSWGGFESMVSVPRDQSTLVRIHVGLEDVETLWKDLESSLEKIGE